MILYGIKNCNTMKKAFDWLNENNVAFEFHDYKKVGISQEKLEVWIAQAGLETIVNKKGTTWRQLSDEQKAASEDQKKAVPILLEKTSMIKRPIIEVDGKIILLGFDEQAYIQNFGR
jgi:Spx/MgsR family transcriptional regulator